MKKVGSTWLGVGNMPQFLRDIRDELKDFPRNHRKYPRLRIRSFESKAVIHTRSIIYRAAVMGETANYVTSIQFFDIDFFDEKDKKDHPLPVKVHGKIHYHQVPSVGRNTVLLKCSCPDFRFRWEKPLFDNGALIGQWRKYTRVTPPPPVGLPHANPEELMGYCKHVNSLLFALKDSGYVQS